MPELVSGIVMAAACILLAVERTSPGSVAGWEIEKQRPLFPLSPYRDCAAERHGSDGKGRNQP